MENQATFWAPFAVLMISVIYFEWRFHMLRDLSQSDKKPYSWARVQLAWWSVIVLASFIAIMLTTGEAPTLNDSTLVLLGISGATITAARLADVSDINAASGTRHQDTGTQNFFLDILSDSNGVSIHRFQTLVFNIGFGVWYIHEVLQGLNGLSGEPTPKTLNEVIPIIEPNNLILLGLSAGTYAALKMTENKTTPKPAAESANTNSNEPMTEPAVG